MRVCLCVVHAINLGTLKIEAKKKINKSYTRPLCATLRDSRPSYHFFYLIIIRRAQYFHFYAAAAAYANRTEYSHAVCVYTPIYIYVYTCTCTCGVFKKKKKRSDNICCAWRLHNRRTFRGRGMRTECSRVKIDD